jgi:hypothetical protein
MQHAYQMSTNRALKAKPLAVKGNVEWAESSIELERLTSRNSTECGYSYIRQAMRGRAKSGMRRFPRKSGHRLHHSREWRVDRKRQCRPGLSLATNWRPDLEIKIVLGLASMPAIGRYELENR